ncbi:hypothetical protein AVEN_40531-1 [Araneus ventricosus]|uniref:Uncharacterized protein n=1 Tax=Araneus ventricosus TaxID=182803 RepID=A0A4Y2M374_ARAVE|nr:hypothetical protein AVEN_40531-1 [Araneus ventricosus]
MAIRDLVQRRIYEKTSYTIVFSAVMGDFTHSEKADTNHSQPFQNGIFGTREGKNNRQVRNPLKFGENDSKWWDSKEPKFQNSIRRFQFETSIRG